jgi:microcystin-dependent protein
VSEPYLGEIRLFTFSYPPKGWALCNGQLLPINQNQALFALLGTTYGGDGRTTFALPNLQGRVPLHVDGTIPLGTRGGSETVTLLESQLPVHGHALAASADVAVATAPGANALAKKPRFGANVYAAPAAPAPLNALSLAAVGGSQPHQNMQPFLTLSFGIALVGIFPSTN